MHDRTEATIVDRLYAHAAARPDAAAYTFLSDQPDARCTFAELLQESLAKDAAWEKTTVVITADHGFDTITAPPLRFDETVRAAGVKNVVVTHAMLAPIHMSIAQMKEAAGMGAWLEFVYNALIGPNKEFTSEDYAKAIREVGPAHCILSSDLGQAANPVHTGGLAAFFAGLERAGVPRADIELMSRTNPARALGLQK